MHVDTDNAQPMPAHRLIMIVLLFSSLYSNCTTTPQIVCMFVVDMETHHYPQKITDMPCTPLATLFFYFFMLNIKNHTL
jgi:hypothetical protein